MARMLNPITYTENVVEDFLRYQLTTYSFADPSLHRQMRQLLNLDQTRRTPLLAGPFVSLSRSFRRGPSMRELADQGVLHPLLANIADHEHLYGHQETAIRSIVAGPEHAGFDGHGLRQDGMLSLSDHQQGAGTPGRGSTRGH